MKTKSFLNKMMLAGMILVLGLTLLPLGSVSAQEPTEGGKPNDPARAGTRLEQAWTRLQAIWERQGNLLDKADTMIDRAQSLIDKASERGYDVSAVQAAMDSFRSAVQDARPAHARGQGIIASHRGFDDSGKVTDIEQARQTVQELAGILKEVRGIVGGPAQALRGAIQAFREANRPADGATVPGG